MDTLKFLRANLDHTRAASSHLIDYIEANSINLAIIGDPCGRSGRLPGLPNSIIQFSQPSDPKVMILAQNILFDPFPVLVSQYVVAVRFSASSFSFLLVAVYAAPSINISEILDSVTQVLIAASANHLLLLVILMPKVLCGEGRYRTRSWGRGCAVFGCALVASNE